MKSIKWPMVLLTVLVLSTPNANAGTYSDRVNFTPGTYLGWAAPWEHTISEIPSGEVVVSANIELEAKVWDWGSAYGGFPLLASDSNVFVLNNEHGVSALTTWTHPSSSSFYTITAALKPNQVDWLANDNNIHFEVYPWNGAYYLDHATLNVITTPEPISMVLFPVGAGVLGFFKRKKIKEKFFRKKL